MAEHHHHHHPRCRRPRSHSHNQPISETDSNPPPIPCIIQSTRSKPTISSILLSTFSPTTTDPSSSSSSAAAAAAGTPKKKNFSSATLRGMGCTASSQVYVPAAMRSSAHWEEEREEEEEEEARRGKKKKNKKKKQRSKRNKAPMLAFDGGSSSSGSSSHGHHHHHHHHHLHYRHNPSSSSSSSSSSLFLSSSCGLGVHGDVWRGPGVDSERPFHRERTSITARRMVTPEDVPFLHDSPLSAPRSRLDVSGTRHHRHGRHGFPEGLAEIVMLQNSFLMGERRSNGLDRYRDWRLDVDNMSYEELLELGDRIGYVSTGLKEEEIARCVKKAAFSVEDNLPHILPEMERKCSVCQEEYEAEDETGKLHCEHFYHIRCIEQWLAKKNCCPICKASAASRS